MGPWGRGYRGGWINVILGRHCSGYQQARHAPLPSPWEAPRSPAVPKHPSPSGGPMKSGTHPTDLMPREQPLACLPLKLGGR